MRSSICGLLFCFVFGPLATLSLAETLDIKNTGEDPITIEFHRRGAKEEPNIPLPLKAGEQRKMRPQEDAFYGWFITDHNDTTHRIGYRRMRGLAVKHPGAVIEIRPQVEEVEAEKTFVVMVPVTRQIIDESGETVTVTELVAETRTSVVRFNEVTSFQIVLTKEDAEDIPLPFRKFAKEPPVSE